MEAPKSTIAGVVQVATCGSILMKEMVELAEDIKDHASKVGLGNLDQARAHHFEAFAAKLNQIVKDYKLSEDLGLVILNTNDSNVDRLRAEFSAMTERKVKEAHQTAADNAEKLSKVMSDLNSNGIKAVAIDGNKENIEALLKSLGAMPENSK